MQSSLENFAPARTTCTACLVPDEARLQYHLARGRDPQRFTYRVISDWLKTEGFDVSADSLRRHFNKGHKAPEVPQFP